MLIATFQLDHDAIALEDAFADTPDMRAKAERIAAHSTRWTMPCLWVTADDFAATDDAIASDSSVDRITAEAEFTDEKYYQIDWATGVEERVNAYIDQQGSILTAEATAQGWELRLRFLSRDQFDIFRETLNEHEHSYELLDLSEPGSPHVSFGGLTPGQRDALVAARDHGYFQVPREISTRELADELDMAHQSLSELIRRGTERLIDATLTADKSGIDE